ncbi:outer membrane lipoprotein carrier protein LolA [Phenylobacterium sp.]|uniref:LolA family protein n=1 Tax=Phenylobacterium sp. TaxID=1871053 RepID=UPI0035AE7B47
MTSLTRRGALALGVAALSAPVLTATRALAQGLSADDQALVDRAVAYLEGLSEAKGRFMQIAPNGSVSEGALYMKRPGKARFDYDPPAGLLVVSDGGRVSIANSKLKTFESYPLMATPLSLFLARQIRLDRGVVISRVSRLSDGFSITAKDGKKQAEGQIVLDFNDAPLRLAGWTVTDAQGQSTRIRLTKLEKTSGLAPSLFVLKDPRNLNPGRAKM